jgi:hypothetical protein
MLTGHVAYPRDSHNARLRAHVSDPPPLPRRDRPELVESFDTLVARAMAKAPEARFATAGELAAALRAAVGEQEAKRRLDAARPTQIEQADKPVSTHDEPFVDAPVPAAAATGGSPERHAAVAAADASGGEKPRRWPLVAAAVALVACAVAAAVLVGGGSSNGGNPTPTATPSGTDVQGELGPVPFNHVDGFGKVVMRLTGDSAMVQVSAKGLLNGFPHLMHIHGEGRGRCPNGSAARRHNGKLAISTKDGAPFYGQVMTSLTRVGNTERKSYLAFGRYPSSGTISYGRRIDLGPVVAAAVRQNTSAVVVIHGIDYNHNDTYDNSLDRSDLDRSLPGEATAPALCGVLKAEQPKRASQTASAVRVYTATLVEAPAPPSSPSLLCDLRSLAGKLL